MRFQAQEGPSKGLSPFSVIDDLNIREGSFEAPDPVSPGLWILCMVRWGT